MKIAITGGSGFIGTALTSHLQEQYPDATLVILDIAESETYPDLRQNIDVRDETAIIKALKDVDIIYHLAAEHRDDVKPVQRYYDTNVGGAQNIIAAAKTHKIKHIIFTSTVAVYGLNAGQSKETDPAKPFNDYGQSKWDSEVLFEQWVKEDPNNKLTTMRFVATFGVGNRGNIYTLINQIARKKFIMIGSGKNKKSIAYLGNVAAFLAHHIDCQNGGTEIYNYADKPDMDMNTLVGQIRQSLDLRDRLIRLPYGIGLAGGTICDIIAKLTGRNLPISTIRVQKFCADTIVNADKAHESGFTAPYSIADGLQNMIAGEFPQYIEPS